MLPSNRLRCVVYIVEFQPYNSTLQCVGSLDRRPALLLHAPTFIVERASLILASLLGLEDLPKPRWVLGILL